MVLPLLMYTRLSESMIRNHILWFELSFPFKEPGVPYNITVRASTVVGEGEPTSIVVFTVQQGNIDIYHS